jgi:uncharacterized membrane protein
MRKRLVGATVSLVTGIALYAFYTYTTALSDAWDHMASAANVPIKSSNSLIYDLLLPCSVLLIGIGLTLLVINFVINRTHKIDRRD